MDKRKLLIYVAGPYSGDTHFDISRNIEHAEAIAGHIWQMGYAAICPHANTRHYEIRCPDLKWKDYIEGDKEILRRCDGIFMLDNWRESRGAVQEHDFAHDIGLPIFYSLPELEHAEW